MLREIAREEGTAAKCGCRQLIGTQLLQNRQKERHHGQTELLGPQTEVSTKRSHRLPVQEHRFRAFAGHCLYTGCHCLLVCVLQLPLSFLKQPSTLTLQVNAVTQVQDWER